MCKKKKKEKCLQIVKKKKKKPEICKSTISLSAVPRFLFNCDEYLKNRFASSSVEVKSRILRRPGSIPEMKRQKYSEYILFIDFTVGFGKHSHLGRKHSEPGNFAKCLFRCLQISSIVSSRYARTFLSYSRVSAFSLYRARGSTVLQPSPRRYPQNRWARNISGFNASEIRKLRKSEILRNIVYKWSDSCIPCWFRGDEIIPLERSAKFSSGRSMSRMARDVVKRFFTQEFHTFPTSVRLIKVTVTIPNDTKFNSKFVIINKIYVLLINFVLFSNTN